MNKNMLPADGGLKEQVRPFEDTFSAWTVIWNRFFAKLTAESDTNQSGKQR